MLTSTKCKNLIVQLTHVQAYYMLLSLRMPSPLPSTSPSSVTRITPKLSAVLMSKDFKTYWWWQESSASHTSKAMVEEMCIDSEHGRIFGLGKTYHSFPYTLHKHINQKSAHTQARSCILAQNIKCLNTKQSKAFFKTL
jgi:hypothetical protein